MKRYLVRHGIDKRYIIKEDKSHSTVENILFSKEIIREIEKNLDNKEIKKTALVTNSFHSFRTIKTAEALGFYKPIVISAYTPRRSMLNNYCRETLSMIKFFGFERRKLSKKQKNSSI